jgi:hypothetical protein
VVKLIGAGGQQVQHYLWRSDVTMTGSAQLVLGRSQARCLLLLHNVGINSMYLEIGSGAAAATLTSGKVSSIAVTNAGFNYSKPPLVRILGGGQAGNSSYLGLNQPNGPGPNSQGGFTGRPATAHAVMTGAVGSQTIASIAIDDGGAGYAIAPYVQIMNDDLDPYGAAVPAVLTGIVLAAGDTLKFDATASPTDPISVIGTAADILTCRWMD